MQKWEYIWAGWERAETVVWENRKQLKDNIGEPRKIHPHEYLNEKGAEGWELVSSFPSPDGGVVFALKRPAPPQPES